MNKYKLIIFDWDGTLAKCDGCLFSGVKKLLKDLKAKKFELAIATSMSTERLNEMIIENELQGLFSCLQTAEMGYAKPDPKMLKQVLLSTHYRAAEAIMVGDSSFDLLMAQEARIDAVGVLSGVETKEQLELTRAKQVLESVNDLPEFLQEAS